MLMLPVFLALYFERNLRSIYQRRFAGLLCIAICNALAQILLEWIGIWNLTDMADVSTAVVGLVCATGLVSLLQMKNKSSRCQKILPILSILLLLTGETVKIVLNFFLCTLLQKWQSYMV